MYKKKLCDMNHTAECRMAGGHIFVVQAHQYLAKTN